MAAPGIAANAGNIATRSAIARINQKCDRARAAVHQANEQSHGRAIEVKTVKTVKAIEIPLSVYCQGMGTHAGRPAALRSSARTWNPKH
jgi:hypothetical protein